MMSSMIRKTLALALLCSTAVAIAAASQYGAAGQGGVGAAPRSDRIASALIQWKRLEQSDTLPFNDYASFLVSYQGWPGEDRMRRIAEERPDASYAAPQSLLG